MKIGTNRNISTTLRNLKAGVKYQARMIVRDKQGNGDENVPAVNFTTDCRSNHHLKLL
jgi:hypothetical protein